MNRQSISLFNVLWAALAEYVHGIYFDRHFGNNSIKSRLWWRFIYKPIVSFQNRNWTYYWHWYAEYCKGRTQFYSKPDTPYLSNTKQFKKFVKPYTNEIGVIDTPKILEERPFSPVESWETQQAKQAQKTHRKRRHEKM